MATNPKDPKGQPKGKTPRRRPRLIRVKGKDKTGVLVKAGDLVDLTEAELAELARRMFEAIDRDLDLPH
jgi:hypothetical protein